MLSSEDTLAGLSVITSYIGALLSFLLISKALTADGLNGFIFETPEKKYLTYALYFLINTV